MLVDELICIPYCSDSSHLSMKSKLTIIAALAFIACTGIPAQAEGTEIENRASVVVLITVTECYVKMGKITQEQAGDIRRAYPKKFPHAKSALEWATTSRNGKAAVRAITPFFGTDCEPDISEETAKKVLEPYLK